MSKRPPRIPPGGTDGGSPSKPISYVISHDDVEYGKKIGSGGYGEVFQGILRLTRQSVAIKKINVDEESGRTQQFLESYQREVASLEKIEHPFLLPLVGYTTEPPYLILTKYIPNGSLSAALHSDHPQVELTGTDLTFIAYGIASGMKYLHAQELMHRDLKPQNILLDDGNIPIISDFGSSKQAGNQLTPTGISGTPQYMAPEFFVAKYDKRIDIYSYGVILWEMLTKEIPFDGLDPSQVICAVGVKDSRPEFPSHCDGPLVTLIEHCWSTNPDVRPSFQDICNVFERGEVAFPDTDTTQFFQMILPFTNPDKHRSRKSRRVSLGSSPTLQLSVSNLTYANLSYQNLLLKDSRMSNYFLETAQGHLAELPRMGPAQAAEAIHFLTANFPQLSMDQLDIWPSMLRYALCCPPNLCQDFEALLAMFAQRSDALMSIAQVPKLSVYVRPETFEVFLYAISFVPNIIDEPLVKAISDYASSEEYGEKAIILLCKCNGLAKNPRIESWILNFFRSIVFTVTDRRGGHLVLRTIVASSPPTEELVKMIAAFVPSKITQHVVAAYHCLFSIRGSPELFQLDNVLIHVQSSDTQLRNAALEFLRRYGEFAIDQPLLKVVGSLVKCVDNYESANAVLLLCRYAGDENQCIAFVNPTIMDQWLQNRNLVRIFVLLSRWPSQFMRVLNHPKSGQFISKALARADMETVFGICWALSLVDLPELFVKTMIDENGVKMLCKYFVDSEDPFMTRHFCSAIVRIAPHGYVPEYDNVVKHLLQLVRKKNTSYLNCIACLSYMCLLKETHKTLISENIFAVLRDVSHVSNAAPYIKQIYNLLHEGGLAVL